MQIKSKIKRFVAGLLVICMAVAVLSPAMLVYADTENKKPEPGEPSKIVFDMGDGPGVGVTELNGRAGVPILDDFSELGTSWKWGVDNSDPDYEFARLNLPDFDDVTWAGYEYEGLFTVNDEGILDKKLLQIPYTFPYENETIFKASWVGDSNFKRNFTVVHQRTGMQDANGNSMTMLFDDNGESGTFYPTEQIGAAYSRSIMGYDYAAGSFSPTRQKKYDGSQGSSIGGFDGSYNFTGKMPNEDVKVTYEYKPDTSKLFSFRVEYIYTDENGQKIAVTPAQSKKYHVEQNIDLTVTPLDVDGYRFVSGSITTGYESTNTGNGVYGLRDINGGLVENGVVGEHGKTFKGKMPNQPVTVTYTYELDEAYLVPIYVEYVDENGVDLRDEEGIDENQYPRVHWVSLNSEYPIPVPSLSGYLTEKSAYVSTGTSLRTVWNQNYSELKVTAGQSGAKTVTIQYVEDINNPELRGWVEYSTNVYGSISGDSSPKSFKVGEYSIDEIVGHFELERYRPVANYMFSGNWYMIDDRGNIISDRLDTVTLNSGETISIMAEFVKDPSKWFDITFRSGSHGSISDIEPQAVAKGTRWSDIVKPTPTPSKGYELDGWYNSLGQRIDSDFELNATMEYVARFVSLYDDGDEDILNSPNAYGKITENGTKDEQGRGVITIIEPDEDRTYVVANINQEILQAFTGDQLRTGKTFAGLDPSTEYEVYEFAEGVTGIVRGKSISDFNANDYSLPTMVKITALGGNYQIQRDSKNSNDCQIVISPAATNTEYAVLDGDSNPIAQGDGKLWVLSSGSPLILTLHGLEEGARFTVVARQKGESYAPEDKEDLGSPVYAYLTLPEASKYVVEVIDGVINRIEDENVDLTSYVGAKAGERIRIDVEDNGLTFEHWEVLIGNISDFGTAAQKRENPTFTMPEGNVVLRAVYKKPMTATASNASVEYAVNAGHEGEVALDLSVAKEAALLDSLLTADDLAILAMDNGARQITYQVRFNKRTASTKETRLIKAEVPEYEDILKAGWAIDTSLYRYVDGARRPLSDDCNPDGFDVFVQIDQTHWDKYDYQLWRVHSDGTVESVEMSPDPNANSEYNGLFHFYGEIDATYVLTYSEAHKLTIHNWLASRHNVTFNIRKGDSLEDCEEFLDWEAPEHLSDTSGILWSYEGLSTSLSRMLEYDISTPVTKNITIYTYYRSSDDAWEDAKKELEDAIKEAEELLKNPNLSEKDKQKLKDAIRDAEDLLDRYPRATTDELIKEKNKIKDIIKGINTGGNGNGNGGNSGGSSGGSGGGSGIKVGTGGNWQLIDAENHKWIFVLTNGKRVAGTWERLSYTHGTVTYTYYYYFDAEGIMCSGWLQDANGYWYYLSTDHDGWFGRMITGWHYVQEDGQWYYFDTHTGAAVSGWKEINGKWYYFTAANQESTYRYNQETGQWVYNGSQERPWGSLVTNATTPDGYQVGSDGALVE